MRIRFTGITAFLAALFLILPSRVMSRTRPDTLLMSRLFSYRQMADTSMTDTTSYIYTKCRFHIDRKNALLMAVPNLFIIARGSKREFITESYARVHFNDFSHYESEEIMSKGTVPHDKTLFPTMLKYLTPNIYGTTLIEGNLLSPFNRHNRIFYRYKMSRLANGNALVAFKPIVRNTQTVRGYATVDFQTGRVIRAELKGEFDMVSFRLKTEMGDSGVYVLMPKTCEVHTRFSFLGNRISGRVRSIYGLAKPLSDTVTVYDKKAIATVRPEPLDTTEMRIYAGGNTLKAIGDTLTPLSDSGRKNILWDVVGRNLLDRIKSRFGKHGEGTFRISPIMNPLYLGYSKRRGITYKFNLSGNYYFTTNSDVSMRIKGGYSFRQRQFYFNIPLKYEYDIRHNGYVEAEIGNGNRITNSAVLDQVKAEKSDTIDWDKMQLDYFKDTYLKLSHNIDITPRLGVKAGALYHKRTPVSEKAFVESSKPLRYNSFAPFIELQIRPWKYAGPILTVDYEQGIRGVMHSNSEYSRWEFDGSYIHRMNCMRSLSMRAGGGFYMSRGDNQYFLDYSNFRDDNIPGGWNDDWSGEFELLNSNWYNASDYYIRFNITYESPLMLLSLVPLVGSVVERERIYVSALSVRRLHPYTEYGYGFTNRLFSMGVFAAMKNTKFDGFGFRFGFELFSHW